MRGSRSTTAGRGSREGRSCSARSTLTPGSSTVATRSDSSTISRLRRQPRRSTRSRSRRSRGSRSRSRRISTRPETEIPATDGPGGLRLRRVRYPLVAPDLLRRPRRARGRHSQAGERSRAADGRRRASLPQGVLPAESRPLWLPARVLDADVPRASAHGPGARRRRRASPRRVSAQRPHGGLPYLAGGGRSGAALPPRRRARRERPGRPLDHRAALRGQPADATRPVRAARAWARSGRCGCSGSSRVCSTSTRDTRRWPRSSSPPIGWPTASSSTTALARGTRALRVHDPYAGAGRERGVRPALARHCLRRPSEAARDQHRPFPRPLPHAARKRRMAGDDTPGAAARPPCQRREQVARRGRPRDVATALQRRAGRRRSDLLT